MINVFDNVYENFVNIKEGLYNCIVEDVFLENNDRFNVNMNFIVRYIDVDNTKKVVLAKYRLSGNSRIKTLTMLLPVLQAEGVEVKDMFNISNEQLIELSRNIMNRFLVLKVEINRQGERVFKNLRILSDKMLIQ